MEPSTYRSRYTRYRAAAVRSLALLVLVAGPWSLSPFGVGEGEADFRDVEIIEVNDGFATAEDLEHVELRLRSNDHGEVEDTHLTFFNADGSAHTVLAIADDDIRFDDANEPFLFATTRFSTVTGVVPDFAMTADVLGPSGMICWGAPKRSSGDRPAQLGTWDTGVVANYVDCVAFGGYTGTLHPTSGAASPLPPGNRSKALVRLANTANDAADFALGQLLACNNEGSCALLVTVSTITTTTSSTTSTTVSSSTSTTVPPPPCCGDANGDGELLASDALRVLQAAVGNPVDLDCPEVCFE